MTMGLTPKDARQIKLRCDMRYQYCFLDNQMKNEGRASARKILIREETGNEFGQLGQSQNSEADNASLQHFVKALKSPTPRSLSRILKTALMCICVCVCVCVRVCACAKVRLFSQAFCPWLPVFSGLSCSRLKILAASVIVLLFFGVWFCCRNFRNKREPPKVLVGVEAGRRVERGSVETEDESSRVELSSRNGESGRGAGIGLSLGPN